LRAAFGSVLPETALNSLRASVRHAADDQTDDIVGVDRFEQPASLLGGDLGRLALDGDEADFQCEADGPARTSTSPRPGRPGVRR
jgi:hypothetical protein